MILYDEQLIERSQAHIDIEDRAYQFGDGIYEVIRVYHGRPFYMNEHLKRLERSAREIRLQIPYSLEKLNALLVELIQQTGLTEGNIYLQISRGTAPRNHAFPKEARPLVIAYPQPSQRPIQELQQGVSTITTKDIRWLRCDIKSLNLLGAALAKQEAVEQGCKEAIFIRDGWVTEGSSTNIFFVREGKIWTHPANHLILHGITRQIALSLAEKLQIPVQLEAIREEKIFEADECFMTSTTMEICPIVRINGQWIGNGKPGPITRQLQQEFEKLIEQF
ncbi:D-amino-acid transaminase [Thermoflavimicrobium dichotomicum]|uniref:D-alanine aminotransferase n=1 Tax=Thermoflavimicrobium dichotomicum TaxID=46223 RepID=A0A1I3QG84_9BACL|nr:D-amino-acid transaminase [Thermoflavimicrobium dichotomicum]SFJ32186.1 D-alanine transaminase [Thermoflavimicrobium dichotomicum]